MNFRLLSFLLFLIFFQHSLHAQSPRQIIDSLRLRIQEDLPADQLANMYGELGWQYAVFNLDSAIYFGELAVEKAKESKDTKILAQSYTDLGSGFLQKGELDEAMKLYLLAREIREESQDSLGLAKVYNALGYIFQRKYESDSAIYFFLKALPIFEKEGALLNAAAVKNNLGVIYQNLPDYDKAIQMYQEVAELRKELGDYRNLVGTYNNLGSCYKYLGDYEQADQYFQDAISLALELDDPLNQAISYRIYSFFLQEIGDIEKLESVAKKGLIVAQSINAEFEKAGLELALGIAYNAQKKYAEAKPLLLEAAEKFKEQGSEEDVLFSYFELIPLYASIGKPDSSRYYANLYQETFRNKLEKESRERTTELETKYQTELKDLQIAEQQLEIRNKNLQLFGSLGLALILAIVGYLLYSQQKLKNKQLKQEGELKAALAQIETQNKLQEQRLLISRDLHDNIGAQLTFIISSIENLKYFDPIKETLTPRYESIANFTKQTIRELRDTIWAMNSGSVSFENLIGRVHNFIQQGQDSTQVKLEFIQDSDVDLSAKMPSATSIQVLRIVQEAIQNALKYGEAKVIQVLITKDSGSLTFQIKDDGKGFDKEKVQLGNGLSNMQKRADEIGGKLEIKAQIGVGTEVILQLSSGTFS
ncbi:tetratricopeptide repeat-containing sensor histidine kinase [Algoriphagus kandeliae]|nr:tetratricopeptide repeat protein [Algoriphagus kandeliae]